MRYRSRVFFALFFPPRCLTAMFDLDSDRLILFALMGLMLVVAALFLVPTTSKSFDEGKTGSEEADHRRELLDALRDQKRRLDEDRASGRITEALYEELLSDLERRMLEEHEGRPSETAEEVAYTGGTKPLSVTPATLTVIVVAILVGIPTGLYAIMGAPEMMRLSQDQKVLEGTAAPEAIETYLRDNGRDGRAWVLLARKRVEAGDYAGAATAYREARKAQTKVRNDPEVMLEFGAALLTSGDARLLPEAKSVLQEALRAQPDNMKAVELLAIAAFQTQDWGLAAEQIRTVLATLEPDSPRYVQYAETLRLLERRAAEAREAGIAPES